MNKLFCVHILQDRDQFTEMLNDQYYDHWINEIDDSYCKSYQFDNENEAINFAKSKLFELNNNPDPNAELYKSFIYKVDLKGKKILIHELSSCCNMLF